MKEGKLKEVFSCESSSSRIYNPAISLCVWKSKLKYIEYICICTGTEKRLNVPPCLLTKFPDPITQDLSAPAPLESARHSSVKKFSIKVKLGTQIINSQPQR